MLGEDPCRVRIVQPGNCRQMRSPERKGNFHVCKIELLASPEGKAEMKGFFMFGVDGPIGQEVVDTIGHVVCSEEKGIA